MTTGHTRATRGATSGGDLAGSSRACYPIGLLGYAGRAVKAFIRTSGTVGRVRFYTRWRAPERVLEPLV